MYFPQQEILLHHCSFDEHFVVRAQGFLVYPYSRKSL
jgi:hypothetical protein